MNIDLISGQIALLHIILENAHDDFEVYGGTQRGAFRIDYIGTTDANREWLCTVREADVVGTPLGVFNIYARQLNTGREYTILSGKIVVTPRTASVPADKLSPVEYFVHVPVYSDSVDVQGAAIIQGIPGPKGDKGDKGEPGEGGVSDEERALLNGAAQRDADNTFTAGNTFTGAVDMSTAQVTPPDGWNVGELTPEAIQAVVPIAWREWTTPPTCNGTVSSLAIGENAQSYAFSDQTIAIGKDSYSIGLALGQKSRAYDRANVIGIDSYGVILSNVFGHKAKAYGDMGVTIGSEYGENVDGNVIFRTCTTEGSGSITIGAGANTLNNGDTESSNSVTIGCKASNISFDSVVIGAQASNENGNSVAVGAGAKTMIGDAVAVGKNATASSWRTVAVGQSSTASGVWSSAFGCYSRATEQNATALGIGANAKAQNATAVGYYAVAADVGVMVFRSESADRTSTQLYFSGANTPLANTYHGGAPMLGYVTKDSAGNIVAAGTRSLIDLLTDNSTFAPASLDENGEWVMPKVFHPSDLDMPQEEPSEPEEYQPLPVYPIVEPEIEPLTE